MGPAGEPIEAVFREERGRLLALLAARFGDLDLAEEVTAEALLAAVETWPRSGVPREPLAWLATTARRKALDRIRRDATLATKLATLHADADPARRTEPVPEHEHIPDDRLQLMFACCHPALDLDTQTGLTLRYIAGLSTAEIAQAFLVPPATMAQRLTRGEEEARVDDHGFAVSLEDQDRGLWDTSMIDEGARLTTQALRHHPPNSWSVQAAIAALHDEASSAQETDWRQVRLLYDELFALTPTPVVALNRAIAISWHEGPQAGLDHLEALADEPGLARQHHWHAARGHTLARLGRHTAAAQAYRRASELAQTPAEIAYLSSRAEEYTTPG